jgi:NodT family efflux transporter outer membrane factor (OMF) lipoprotein
MQTRRQNGQAMPSGSRVVAACLGMAAALGLGGCTVLTQYLDNGFKVGPNYCPPPVPLTAKWIDESDAHVLIGSPNLACWWNVFGDPVLVDLIQRSYSSNLTLRAAGFQILASQEQRRIAASELLPQSQTASFSYLHSQASNTGGAAVGAAGFFGTGLAPSASPPPVIVPSTPIAGLADPGLGSTNSNVNTGGIASNGVSAGGNGGRFFDNWATSMNMSWELDFWGLFRRNLEAANASLDQSIFNSDEMTVLVLANVATQYVEIRTLQRRLELARKNVALQEPLVSQFEQRYKQGIANSHPGFAQLRSNLENTRALIPQLETSLRQANNQLCNLLGIPMQDLASVIGDGMAADAKQPDKHEVRIPQPVDYSVVVGIPGEVLLQRPDVRAAEQQLRIQSAEIGIAEAEMFPHIGINGSIGLASSRFNQLFHSQSGTGTVGPSLTWNILNYGRLLANVRLQNDVYQQDVAQYQQAILNANQDAENALTAYLRSMEQADHLRKSAESAADLTEYLLRQFRQGYLPPGAADTSAFINQVFTAINFQVQQQDAAAQAEGNIALNLILIYRAMGGGWQLRLTNPNHPACNPVQGPLEVLTQPVGTAANQARGNPNPQPSVPHSEPEVLPAAINITKPSWSGGGRN